MAITETTKSAVSAHKANLRNRWDHKGAQIADLQAQITKLQGERAALRAQYEALDADIPEPTPSEEPV